MADMNIAASASAPGLNLQGASETLLIPLAARTIGAALFPHHAAHDPAAKEVLASLGIDLTRYSQRRDALEGCLIRGKWFDDITATFLADAPGGQVVSLGSGLDTRFERMRDKVPGTGWNWIDADLPPVTALRVDHMKPDHQRRHVAADLSQSDWLDVIDVDRSRPTLFVAEGLLMYLPPGSVRSLLERPAEEWNDGVTCRFVFDWLSPLLRRGSRRVAAIQQTSDQSVRFQSSLRGVKDIEKMHPRWKVTDYSNARARATPRSRIINTVYRALSGHDLVGWTVVSRS